MLQHHRIDNTIGINVSVFQTREELLQIRFHSCFAFDVLPYNIETFGGKFKKMAKKWSGFMCRFPFSLFIR